MKLDRDLQGLWVWRLVSRWERIKVLLCSGFTRIDAAWWGVGLGAGCRFYGRPMFRRHPGCVIRIGGGCQFRSAFFANPLGINRPCLISAIGKQSRVLIGSGCGFSGTVIAAVDSIQIGNRVLCGANTTITDTDSHTLNPQRRLDEGETAPVVIEDNVWLGLNVLVLKGVTIGRDSVIGAGSIVTRSIPPGVVAAGQPARVLRHLSGPRIVV